MFTLSLPSGLAGLTPLVESLRRDAKEGLAAFMRDYVHQAGYRVGVDGEWLPIETREPAPSR